MTNRRGAFILAFYQCLSLVVSTSANSVGGRGRPPHSGSPARRNAGVSMSQKFQTTEPGVRLKGSFAMRLAGLDERRSEVACGGGCARWARAGRVRRWRRGGREGRVGGRCGGCGERAARECKGR